MNQDEIIRMAREAGLAEWHESIQQHGFTFAEPDRLERFAALVSGAEREACAKACEETRIVKGGEVFAAKIRARGNT